MQDIPAAVTPGGGKNLLPVITAQTFVAACVVDRGCWVVPRDSLRLREEEAFADPAWRGTLGHDLAVHAAESAPDPCRDGAGYVTTHQGVAASDLHLSEFRHRYLLVVEKVHHLPALQASGPAAAQDTGADEASGWSRALLPLLETARVRLLLPGTLERADGSGILWLPYRNGPKADTREVDPAAEGWAVVGYSRAQALSGRAVLPVTFGALGGEASCEASWLERNRLSDHLHLLDGDTRYAWTARQRGEWVPPVGTARQSSQSAGGKTGWPRPGTERWPNSEGWFDVLAGRQQVP